MTIKDIAEAMHTSPATVSRVLNGIAIRNKDLAEKIRQTAESMKYQPNEAGRNLRLRTDSEYGPVFEVRSTQQLHVKRMIAARAAGMVSPSDVVILDSGSTISEMAVHLPPDVLVYTNSLAVLQPLARRGAHVHLAPGFYVPELAAVLGPETEEYFTRHRATLYFLSTARVDVRTGLFNVNPATHGVKLTAMAHASKKVLLAHHDKFCDAGLEAYAPLSTIDMLITDSVPPAFRDAIHRSGVEVIETDAQR